MPRLTRSEVEILKFNGKYQLLSNESPCLSCETETVKPTSYSISSVIGTGSFGQVYKVKEIKTEKSFALKVIAKDKTLRNSDVSRCVEERRLLAAISCPFIVKYEAHFQTKSSLCLVMEYVDGGDLFQILKTKKYFDEEVVRFYLSEILLSLEYLHKIGLIYRDLKLENIMIDRTGHVKMVDLGFTRLVRRTERCSTFCGTIQYLAPEILRGVEYNKAVDWWAFGILAYELRYGDTPFSSQEKDTNLLTQEIREKIMRHQLSFPDYFEPDLKSLVSKLLIVSPLVRLGSRSAVRGDTYFSQVNFEDIYDKSVKPPYIPNRETRVLQKFEEFESEFYQSVDENDIEFKDF